MADSPSSAGTRNPFLSRSEIVAWLDEHDPGRTAQLFREADRPGRNSLERKSICGPLSNFRITGTVDPLGRQKALQSGANVVMPNATPRKFRKHYQICPNKICVEESPSNCRFCVEGMVSSLGRRIGSGSAPVPKHPFGQWTGKEKAPEREPGCPGIVLGGRSRRFVLEYLRKLRRRYEQERFPPED